MPHKILDLLTPAERRSAAGLLVLMFVGMVLETLGVGLVVPVVALLMREDPAQGMPWLQPLSAWAGGDADALVVGGMLVLVGVYIIKAVFLAFLAWRQTEFAFGVQASLSQRLFAIYLRQPYTFHLQRNSAQLVRNVMGEVSQLTFDGIVPAMVLATEGLVLAGLCVLLVATEPLGALSIMALLAAAGWAFHRLTHSRAVRWSAAFDYHEDLRIQHLMQGLGGAKDVKLLGRESQMLEQYNLHNVQSARAGQMHATLLQIPRLWLEVLAVTGLAVIVVGMVWQNRTVGIIPVLAMFTAAAFRLIPSVNRILNALQCVRHCAPVIASLNREVRLPVSEDRDAGRPATPFGAEISLRRVSYTYPEAATPALEEVSMEVRCGESVGIVGPSGAGKSTLVDIVLGLLTPDAGQVLVDGHDIRSDIRNWQDQIGYVPQSIYLTDDTLRRNVAFGVADAQIDDDAIRRAIRASQLEEFVGTLPDGLETVVGERGVRLSGGQRQRVGIARALYHDPAVLVLDEATSSLDTATESEVMDAVAALQGAKTILIVSHRQSTVRHCERLYSMKEGAGFEVIASNAEARSS